MRYQSIAGIGVIGAEMGWWGIKGGDYFLHTGSEVWYF